MHETSVRGAPHPRPAQRLAHPPPAARAQVSVQLADVPASVSPLKGVSGADEPIVLEWTHKFGLEPDGDDTAAVQSVLYAKPQRPPVPGADLLSTDGLVPPRVRAAFRHFDGDSSGGIDTRELSAALRQLGMEADSQQTIAILQRFDKNSSGSLDVHQFGELVQARAAFGG